MFWEFYILTLKWNDGIFVTENFKCKKDDLGDGYG